MIETLVEDVCVMLNVRYKKGKAFKYLSNEEKQKCIFNIKSIDIKEGKDIQEQMTIDDIIFGK